MTEKSDVIKVMTPEFRVSFPYIFEPREKVYEDTGKTYKSYELAMLFAKGTDLSALKEAAKEAAVAKWGTTLPKKLKSPFLNAGEYDYEGYEDGMVLIRTSTNTAPGLIDANLQSIIDPAEFYAGCYARATIVAAAYVSVDKNTKAILNQGVKFYLNNVQKLRDGEPLGRGRASPEEDFGGAPAAGAAQEQADDPFS